MKSKYQHTFQKGLEAIGKVQLVKISKIVGNGNVIGRKSYYGQIIFNNFSSFKNSLNLEPRDLAVCLHLFFGLPVKYGDIACSDMQDLLFVSNEVVDAFFKILDQMYKRCYPVKRKVKLSTNSISKLRNNILNRIGNKNNLN